MALARQALSSGARSIQGENPTLRLGDELTPRAAAIVGMVASAIWVVALFAEYRLGFQPPGNGSAA
jgi:hypothetical protein